jgi:hypothetical protein
MPDDDFGGFAPPPFKADDALIALERKLRDLKLTKRGAKEFMLAGRSIAEVSSDGSVIHARIVKRPAVTPEWGGAQTLKNAADVRKFTDTLAHQLRRWGDDE